MNIKEEKSAAGAGEEEKDSESKGEANPSNPAFSKAGIQPRGYLHFKGD